MKLKHLLCGLLTIMTCIGNVPMQRVYAQNDVLQTEFEEPDPDDMSIPEPVSSEDKTEAESKEKGKGKEKEKEKETEPPVAEKTTLGYLEANVDRSLIGEGKLNGINQIELATTMYDGSIGNKTLNEFMLTDKDKDGFMDYLPYLLGQYNTYVGLYALSPDSEWAVARVDVMKNATITDWDGGRNDDSGTSWKNQMKFDMDKGLLYIPTKLLSVESFVKDNAVVQAKNNKEVIQRDIKEKKILLNPIRVQLFYAIHQEVEPTEITVGETNNSKTLLSSIYDDTTEFDIGKGKTVKGVIVNGGALLDREYTYNSDTGILTVNRPSATITDAQIDTGNYVLENILGFLNKIKVRADDTMPVGTFTTPDGYTYTWTAKWWDSPIVYYNGEPHVGDTFDLKSSNNYVPDDNRAYQYIKNGVTGWKEYTAGTLASGEADLLWFFNNDAWATNLVMNRLIGVDGKMSTDPKGNIRTADIPAQVTPEGIQVTDAKFLLRCMHFGITGDFQYLGKGLDTEEDPNYPTTGENQPNVRVKVARVEGDTMIIAIVTPNAHAGPTKGYGQAGIGYYKVKWVTKQRKKITVSKKDVAGAEVPGAKLTLKDEKGAVVDEWVSTSTPHEIAVVEGQKYTLVETNAPGGMNYAESITFIAGEASTITMKDTVCRIYKKDSNGQLVRGAIMQIVDSSGNVVDEWKTNHQLIKDPANPTVGNLVIPHEGAKSVAIKNNQLEVVYDGKVDYFDIDEQGYETSHRADGLRVGQKYTLQEKSAPAGYGRAEPIEFTPSAINDIEFTMIDYKNVFHKTDVTGEEIPGAHITITDEDGNIVDEFVSTTEPHPISNLEYGKKYTLREEIAPGGYVTANTIEFVAGEDTELFMVDTVVSASKVDSEGKYLSGAQLQVLTKDKKEIVDEWVSGQKVIDLETNEVTKYVLKERTPEEVVKVEVINDSKTVHIAYSDKTEEFFDIDSEGYETSHRVRGLSVATDGTTYTGKYILREVSAPVGYGIAKDVVFEPKQAENVFIHMKDFSLKIVKSREDKNLVKGAKLKVTDTSGKVIDEWTSGQHIADIKEDNLKEVESQGYSNLELSTGIGVTQKAVYNSIDTLVEYVKTNKPQKLVTNDFESVGSENNLKLSDYVKAIFQKMPMGEEEYAKVCMQAEKIVNSQPVEVQRKQLRDLADEKMNITKTYQRAVLKKSEDSKGGYVILVVDKDGMDKVVDVDKFGDEAGHRLVGFDEGKEYILSEISSPAGYKKAIDMHFMADIGTDNLVVTMIDNLLVEEASYKTGIGMTNPILIGATAILTIGVLFVISKQMKKREE